MKRLRSPALLLLALLLALSGPTAPSAGVLGLVKASTRASIAPGLTLAETRFWSAADRSFRTERCLAYTPSPEIVPTVCYGETILKKSTLSDLAALLTARGGTVLAGVNGDFYDMATGNPLGIVVSDGILRSSAYTHEAVGFLADGSAFIGKPRLHTAVRFPGQAFRLTNINKTRTALPGGCYLLTGDYSATTENTSPGLDVILNPGGANLKIGTPATCTVEAVLHAQGPAGIPAGRWVLTIDARSDPQLLAQAAALRAGDQVEIRVTSGDPRWSEAVAAVGAFYRIVTAGALGPDLDDAPNPRTAIGLRPDGTVLFYTLDGHQPGYSTGGTLAQVAARMLELGCVDAVGMDGDGSAMLGAALPGGGFQTLNRPSDGRERQISNGVFLVSAH